MIFLEAFAIIVRPISEFPIGLRRLSELERPIVIERASGPLEGLEVRMRVALDLSLSAKDDVTACQYSHSLPWVSASNFCGGGCSTGAMYGLRMESLREC